MISDLSVIWISISVIVLCWAVIRVNQKIDEMIRNHRYSNTLDVTVRPEVSAGLPGDPRTESKKP